MKSVAFHPVAHATGLVWSTALHPVAHATGLAISHYDGSDAAMFACPLTSVGNESAGVGAATSGAESRGRLSTGLAVRGSRRTKRVTPASTPANVTAPPLTRASCQAVGRPRPRPRPA